MERLQQLFRMYFNTLSSEENFKKQMELDFLSKYEIRSFRTRQLLS